MKTVFGVSSVTPINKRLKNGYTMYEWVMRQKGFPAFCMRTLCGEDKITAGNTGDGSKPLKKSSRNSKNMV